jgi:hypothetical protein
MHKMLGLVGILAMGLFAAACGSTSGNVAATSTAGTATAASTSQASTPAATATPIATQVATAVPIPTATPKPKATPLPEGVLYACTGSTPNGVDITYGSDSSSSDATALPFSATSALDSSAEYYTIMAQLQGGGSVNCTLTVQSNASGTVTKTGSANGGYTIADLEICSDFTGGWETC